jgi:hypothetical protein
MRLILPDITHFFGISNSQGGGLVIQTENDRLADRTSLLQARPEFDAQ